MSGRGRHDAAQTHVTFDPKKVLEISFSPDCRVNVTDEQLLAQVAENIRRGLPQAMPYDPNPDVAILVAGGPSLKTTEKELVETIWRTGGKVFTVNGAYQWCISGCMPQWSWMRVSSMRALSRRQCTTAITFWPRNVIRRYSRCAAIALSPSGMR
jgi:hypothetical protein